MTTREKILEASRNLFNSNGLNNVSVMDICKTMNISAGNFTYHFPKKDQIVVELYYNMLKEIQQVVSSIETGKISILFYLESHKQIFLVQIKFKFIYLNLFEVLNNYPEVKSIYLKNSSVEREMAIKLLKLYVSEGIIKKGINSAQYERILNVGQMLSNSWLIDAEMRFQNSDKSRLAYYLSICCGLLEPYLNKRPLEEYRRFFKKMN